MGLESLEMSASSSTNTPSYQIQIDFRIYNLLYKFGAAAESQQDPVWESDNPGRNYPTFYYLPDTVHGVDNFDPKLLSAMLLKLRNIS